MCGIDTYMQESTDTHSINLLKGIIGENNSSKIIMATIIGLLLTLTLINELLKLQFYLNILLVFKWFCLILLKYFFRFI